MEYKLNQTYEEFISQFPVYDSQYHAKAKGFEAHHIVPRAVQKREQGKVYDDRCVRLTVAQHIVAHYLYCKEHPNENEEFGALNCMVNMKAKKLLEDDYLFVKELPNLTELREQSHRKHTPEEIARISEAKKGEKNPMWGKFGEKHHNYGKHPSEETLKKASSSHKGKESGMKGKHHTEEAKKKNSDAHKGEKNGFYGKHHTEEVRERMSKKVYVYDTEGNLLHTFKSVKETSMSLGVSMGTVSRWIKEGMPKKLEYSLSYTN